jgi:hypothetical protein
MSEFKSDPVTINTTDKAIYSFLGNFNNFGQLMPEQVVNWQSTEDSCSFTIKGMADLAMIMDRKTEYSQVSYASAGDSPFPFSLTFTIDDHGGTDAEVSALLDARLNPMVKMMASRPLQNFVNLLVGKLKEVMERP